MNTPKIIAGCAIFTWATSTFAHDGHGLAGLHWHSTDVWGFAFVAALFAAAVWLARK